MKNFCTFDEYYNGVKEFQKVTRNWQKKDQPFYSVDKNGFLYFSWDNAYGGLDVSWAFHRKTSKQEILENYLRLIDKEFTLLLENIED